jgi:hypothetical protein
MADKMPWEKDYQPITKMPWEKDWDDKGSDVVEGTIRSVGTGLPVAGAAFPQMEAWVGRNVKEPLERNLPESVKKSLPTWLYDPGAVSSTPEESTAKSQKFKEEHPGLSTAGNIYGGVLGSAPAMAGGGAVATALGLGRVAAPIVAGATGFGGLNAADTAARGGSAFDIATSGAIGAGLGGGGAALIPMAAPVAGWAIKGMQSDPGKAAMAFGLKRASNAVGLPGEVGDFLGDYALAKILKKWDPPAKIDPADITKGVREGFDPEIKRWVDALKSADLGRIPPGGVSVRGETPSGAMRTVTIRPTPTTTDEALLNEFNEKITRPFRRPPGSTPPPPGPAPPGPAPPPPTGAAAPWRRNQGNGEPPPTPGDPESIRRAMEALLRKPPGT